MKKFIFVVVLNLTVVLSPLVLTKAISKPASEKSQTTTAQSSLPSKDVRAPRPDTTLLEGGLTAPAITAIKVLPAGANDKAIAQLTSGLLENQHYLQRPLDDEISSKFLDRYMDTLDPLHSLFLQSDQQAFEGFRKKLDDLTRKGDTEPGRIIFRRLLQRLQQRVDFAHDLLLNGKFDFNEQERYNLDRKNAPRPKDINEAKELWRKQVKYELLQERLQFKPAKADSAKNDSDKPENKLESPKTDKAANNGASDEKRDKEAREKIEKRYVRLLHTLEKYDSSDVLELYLSALTHVYDPHSDYMGKSQLDNFAIGMKLSLFGIGAVLQSEDGYCKIKQLVAGGPAAKSKKLKENDKIVAVAQGDSGKPVDVVDERLMKIVEMIRGPKGTLVQLTVIPADATDPSETKVIKLVRDEIPLEDQEAKAKIIELPGENGEPVRIGVIDLPSFYRDFNLDHEKSVSEPKSTTVDVAKLLRKLKRERVAGLILDLRRNGGGSLEEAITLTGLFIKEGPVVQVRDHNNKIIVDSDTDPSVLYDGPMIVLTSRFSASASEILAGALQDYGRALVVGDSSTHGKGTVQSLISLEPYIRQIGKSQENPGAVKLTIRKFYRASGSSTQLKGVAPDLTLPSLNDYGEFGEGSLENPLPWDTIPSQKFEKLNRVQPFLAELRKRDEKRIETDPDFRFLKEEIERVKKQLADKSVSLNEAERNQEKKDAEERSKRRQADLKARPEPNEKTYELTVKLSDAPGLPAPVSKTNELAKAESKISLNVSPEEEEENKLTFIDIPLKETKRILLDYISLSEKGAAFAVTNP